MLEINEETAEIAVTRGNGGIITLDIENEVDGSKYMFKTGDMVRFKVFDKKNCREVLLTKDFQIENYSASVDITLTDEDTKIGELSNKPIEYWYEIELNPHINTQTVVGYDKNGEKKFILYPEGGD